MTPSLTRKDIEIQQTTLRFMLTGLDAPMNPEDQTGSQTIRLVSPEVEAFCLAHSSPLSPITRELDTYTRNEVPRSVMLVGELVGSFLRWMVRATQSQRVLEVGCYTGFSALCMAEGLPNSGKLVTLDIDAENAKIAKEYWSRSPHGSKIELVLGDAKETLATLPGPFDFIFIDADKVSYQTYVELALSRLSPKGIIICDNCLYDGQVLETVPKERNGRALKAFDAWVRSRKDLDCVLLPIRDGLMCIKKAESV